MIVEVKKLIISFFGFILIWFNYMADSSSESEQSFDIDNIHEDNREHVREVLAKGKEIIPYYSVIDVLCRILYYLNCIRNIIRLIKSSIMSLILLRIERSRAREIKRVGLLSARMWRIKIKIEIKPHIIFWKIRNVRLVFILVIWRANNWDKP